MHVDAEMFKRKIKPLFAQAPYCSVATVKADGTPHVSPIGSVVLVDQHRGWFFQKFTKNIPQNSTHCEYATIMAVNAGSWFWLKSLVKGGFKTPPAMRIQVRLGELLDGTKAQKDRFQRRVSLFKRTRGYEMMWKDMSQVRAFEIISFQPVYIGKMTAEQFK